MMIKFYFLILITTALVPKTTRSQNQIISVSQNTNFYIDKISSGNIYISSLDGLNIHDGNTTKIFRPNNSNNIYGRNIQSHFHEDSHNRVWFTTYEALHFHDIVSDTFKHIFLKDTIGSIIDEDYMALGLINDSILVVGCGKTIHEFDINKFCTNIILPIDLSKSYFEELHLLDNGYLLTSNTLNGFRIQFINNAKYLTIDTLINISGTSSLLYDQSNLIIGGSDGVVRTFDINKLILIDTFKISEFNIIGLSSSKKGECYATTTGGEIFNFNIAERSKRIINYSLCSKEKLPKYSFAPLTITNENNYWVGVEGKGVMSGIASPTAFEHFPETKNISVKEIIPIHKGYFLTTNENGYYIIDNYGGIVHRARIKNLMNSTTYYSGYSNDYIYISNSNTLYELNLKSLKTTEVKKKPVKHLATKDSLCFGIDQKSDALVAYSIENPNKWHEVINAKTVGATSFNSLKIIGSEYLFLGDNDNKILIFKFVSKNEIHKIKTVNLKGQLKFITQPAQNRYILGTDYGIHLLDKDFNILKKIEDDNAHLTGTVYGVLLDDNGNYWCSTNNGIIKYDPVTNHSHQFKMKDGLQGMEYNTDSYLKLDDGRMIFGGVNGLNIFHPDSIKLSEYQTKVTISEFELMDEPNTEFGQPNYLKNIDLTYDRNYFDFTLVGTDYSSLEDVQLRYKLDGFDKDWQTKPNRHIAEYKQVPPGDYTFRVIASNADGIWSSHERTIDISISPPWWQTWWFRSLAIISLGGLLFAGFRYYFNQKLKEKDYQLKAQQLTIEKQQALTAERTRIAAEMHDDLGGGLTTIKFLSQKAIRKIDDDKVKSQMQKIVDNAQTLVGNMSEIIWAMNAGFDTLDNLVAYSRRYAFEFLEDHEIKLEFKVKGTTENIDLTGEQRRNIFLVIKEVLNNSVKHAQASQVKVTFEVGESLSILISDNGIGLKEDNAFGNGLNNIKKRIELLNGKTTMYSSKGTHINIKIPLPSTHSS